MTTGIVISKHDGTVSHVARARRGLEARPAVLEDLVRTLRRCFHREPGPVSDRAWEEYSSASRPETDMCSFPGTNHGGAVLEVARPLIKRERVQWRL